jgi:hypothetical protein
LSIPTKTISKILWVSIDYFGLRYPCVFPVRSESQHRGLLNKKSTQALGTEKSIQLVELIDTFEFLFLKLKSVSGTRPRAAGPAPADLLGVPTQAASVWLGPAGPEANQRGRGGGDIVLGEGVDISGAVIARRDDSCCSEHGSHEESENGDLHGSGRPDSQSAVTVGTGTGTVPD